ncbi:MAG TPA: tRNA pseudouridine(55) synthase TruB [Bryobacteraceae bacterium]|nr:tRNA pseudouridine(55) synthase TruB [Bryobacteraceae bacterium]
MPEPMDGIIVVDKPAGWTSHDVVNRMRRLAGTRKVGHLGTLDPMATGVLPLVIGRATRLAQFFMRSDKVYDAHVRFGYATSTYDGEGTPISNPVEPVLTRETLEDALQAFRGEFLLRPPPVSAKKVQGTPAYRLARKQIEVDLKPIPVNVYELKLVEWVSPEARLWARCSAGTYMRTIAHELGEVMGCGAHLSALRRLCAGDFSIEQAHSLDELATLSGEGRLVEALIPATELLPEFPSVIVDDTTAGMVRQGRDFPVSPFRAGVGARYVKAVSREGRLVAIGEAKLPHIYHPVVVM